MPWTAEEFRNKVNKDLTVKQAKMAAQSAKGILKETGNEALAIKTANARIKLSREWL
jgi:uncharacterized protein YdaT